MDLICDADVPRAFADAFREQGFTVLDVRDEGFGAASDEAIFRLAAERGALLLTGDLGFSNPLRFPREQLNGLIINRLPPTLPLTERTRALERLLSLVEPMAFRGYISTLEIGRLRRRRI